MTRIWKNLLIMLIERAGIQFTACVHKTKGRPGRETGCYIQHVSS